MTGFPLYSSFKKRAEFVEWLVVNTGRVYAMENDESRYSVCMSGISND